MENENNYPNGWKDGWSSADHATVIVHTHNKEKKETL